MSNITNKRDIPLPLAVWLVSDFYDYVDTSNYVSATTLLKPLREIIISSRMDPAQNAARDVESYVSSAIGTAIHDAVERSWNQKYKESLASLGYPSKMIQRIRINPTEQDLKDFPDCIPVYFEQRSTKEIAGTLVGGKYDFIMDGVLYDVKTSSVYSWMGTNKDEDYQLQGSIYRWLNPVLITEDEMYILFVFTDWQASQAQIDPKYPQSRIEYKKIQLLSLGETERWLTNKLRAIKQLENQPEEYLPLCTDAELWRKPTTYKYYANPQNTAGRSTKNFDNAHDANLYKAQKKGVGVVIEVKGAPVRCRYCTARPECSQAKSYLL